MTRIFLCLPLAFLAACGDGADVAPGANRSSENAETPAAAARPPALAGEWAVTAYNGAALTQVFPMTATFAGDRLTISSECVRMAWTYTQDGMTVAFKPAGGGGCARTATHNEDQVEKAIASATMAMFSDDGGEVSISGSGGTVTMTKR